MFQRQPQQVGHPLGRDGLGRLVFVERRGTAAENLAGLTLGHADSLPRGADHQRRNRRVLRSRHDLVQGRVGIVVVRPFKNPVVTVFTVPAGLLVGQRLALKGNGLFLNAAAHDAVAGGAGPRFFFDHFKPP